MSYVQVYHVPHKGSSTKIFVRTYKRNEKIHCSRLPTLQYSYNINHQPLNVTDQHLYLGVTIHKSMSWASHINTIVLKASKTLNFIKRNLYMCSKEVKETAYLTLVRPCLEYASSVWDPYQLYLISNIEKTQRRAARWTLSDYNRYSQYVETTSVVGPH